MIDDCPSADGLPIAQHRFRLALKSGISNRIAVFPSIDNHQSSIANSFTVPPTQ
jgi:hypothetical protein